MAISGAITRIRDNIADIRAVCAGFWFDVGRKKANINKKTESRGNGPIIRKDFHLSIEAQYSEPEAHTAHLQK